MRRLLALLAACGPAARPTAPSNTTITRAPTPCVPALTSQHLAITGAVGAYGAAVIAIAVSPDHHTIAQARTDGVLQVDDLASRTTRCTPGVFAFALSEDARWAAALELTEPTDEWPQDAQRGLALWDVGSGTRVAQAKVATPELLAGAVSDRGAVAVTGYSDSEAQVLFWNHGAPRELPARGWPARPAFSRDGETLLSASSVGVADLYRAPDWKDEVTTPTSSDDPNAVFAPIATATSSDQLAIAGWRDDHPVLELWQAGGRNARFVWRAPADLPLLAQSPVERVVPVPGGEDVLQRAAFGTIALSPDEGTIVAGFDGLARVLRYDAHTGATLDALPLVAWWPTALAYSGDGRWLVVADAEGAITIFDGDKQIATSAQPEPKSTDVQTEDRQGDRVLIGRYGKVSLDDASGRELWSVTTERESDDHRVVLSPSGRYAWSGGNDSGILIDAATGKLLWTANASYGAYEAAFTPDETSIVMSTADGIVVYDVAHGTLVRSLDDSKDALHFALSPDGKHVLGGYDGTVKEWDVATGSVLIDTPLDEGVFAMSAAYSPDGTWAVTAEEDTVPQRWGTIRLWDAATGRSFDTLSLDPLEARPKRVAFTGDDTFTVLLDNGSTIALRTVTSPPAR